MNLNPMFFWKYVKGYYNRVPCILIKGEPSEALKTFIKSCDYCNFIVEDSPSMINAQNVLYQQKVRLTEEEWLRRLSTVDYVVCNENDIDYWPQIALCGVKVCFNEDIFKESLHVLSYVERIENWEKAKTLLT